MSRVSPKKVSPVFYKGMKFESSLIGKKSEQKTVGVIGYITAFDEKTNNLIWQKDIYTINFDLSVETDIQQVYISELFIENNKLIAINEHKERYEINPVNGDIIND